MDGFAVIVAKFPFCTVVSYQSFFENPLFSVLDSRRWILGAGFAGAGFAGVLSLYWKPDA